MKLLDATNGNSHSMKVHRKYIESTGNKDGTIFQLSFIRNIRGWYDSLKSSLQWYILKFV